MVLLHLYRLYWWLGVCVDHKKTSIDLNLCTDRIGAIDQGIVSGANSNPWPASLLSVVGGSVLAIEDLKNRVALRSKRAFKKELQPRPIIFLSGK